MWLLFAYGWDMSAQQSTQLSTQFSTRHLGRPLFVSYSADATGNAYYINQELIVYVYLFGDMTLITIIILIRESVNMHVRT